MVFARFDVVQKLLIDRCPRFWLKAIVEHHQRILASLLLTGSAATLGLGWNELGWNLASSSILVLQLGDVGLGLIWVEDDLIA